MKVPELVKQQFSDQQQKAINELEAYFNRESNATIGTNHTTESSGNIQFNKTKIGFNKSKDESDDGLNRSNTEICDFKFNINDFQILHTLGKGSSALVKLAKHKKKNLRVVLKTYDKYKLIEGHLKKALMKEVEILKSISHPNIVKLYDVIEDDRSIHLVMEYVNGGSLQQNLRLKSKKLEVTECKRVFKQIVDAVKYIHSKNIFHRDIKLENILLDYRRNVKLIDFGFSII